MNREYERRNRGGRYDDQRDYDRGEYNRGGYGRASDPRDRYDQGGYEQEAMRGRDYPAPRGRRDMAYRDKENRDPDMRGGYDEGSAWNTGPESLDRYRGGGRGSYSPDYDVDREQDMARGYQNQGNGRGRYSDGSQYEGYPRRGSYNEERQYSVADSAGYGSRYGASSQTRERYGSAQSSRNSHAGKGPKGYQRTHERLTEDVCERLTWNSELDASNIEVKVEDDEVTLEGTVDSRQAKRTAEDLAESVSGVRDVHNRLQIRRGEQSGESSSEEEKSTKTSQSSSSKKSSSSSS